MVSGIFYHTKADKFLKGSPIVCLEFKLFNRKRKATPTLRLISCWRTSILNRIRGSILLSPAFLLRSCVQPLSRSGWNDFYGIESASRLRTGFLSWSLESLCCSSHKPLGTTAHANMRDLSIVYSMPHLSEILIY